LFFFRHPRLSLAPGSSVQMEWTFQNAEPARMLHGTALETVDRCGVWMELHDTRPLRELRTLHNVRRHRRMATDRQVQTAWSGRWPTRGRARSTPYTPPVAASRPAPSRSRSPKVFSGPLASRRFTGSKSGWPLGQDVVLVLAHLEGAIGDGLDLLVVVVARR